ncbi:ubiquinone biosynthesis accessory factor UbiJ [Massilia sp. DWR3-1-1]|uniref:ubiquinone biosynthesis accessory factor UbiJ n=1 Tax=Massilia sp. DWR3-1-1 TaxID=2804559 RepID=UPI003CE85A52
MPSSSFLFDLSLATPAVAAINHLLAQEGWARELLRPHAGKLALIDAGSIALRLAVTADGMLAAGALEAEPAVTIRMKLSDLPLIAQQRERAFSFVKIEGDAEFANTISQLSKHLRWEPEADLERFAGPIAATRLTEGARGLFAAAVTGQRKLSENVAEYLAEEQGVLVRPALLEAMGADITRLRDDVERAAKRIARLDDQLNKTAAAPRGVAVLPPSLDR